MKIRVTSKNEVFIDGKKTQISGLTPEILGEIVDLSLNNEVEYEIDGESPIGNFFKRIDENTRDRSEFKTKVDNLKRKMEEEADLIPNYLKTE